VYYVAAFQLLMEVEICSVCVYYVAMLQLGTKIGVCSMTGLSCYAAAVEGGWILYCVGIMLLYCSC
jgi:hypothetical protein